MSTIHAKARSWINSQILSHGGCIERLTSINNDQVNEKAKQEQIGRMYEEMQIWQYIATLLDAVFKNDEVMGLRVLRRGKQTPVKQCTQGLDRSG